eukprot:366546-Chlamydomonas_euryale.AAC.54
MAKAGEGVDRRLRWSCEHGEGRGGSGPAVERSSLRMSSTFPGCCIAVGATESERIYRCHWLVWQARPNPVRPDGTHLVQALKLGQGKRAGAAAVKRRHHLYGCGGPQQWPGFSMAGMGRTNHTGLSCLWDTLTTGQVKGC